jgi:3-phosphoshikimate 1-carboxyvinyltransferase
VAMSQDVEATLRCLTALGGRWQETAPGVLEVTGTGGRRTGADLPRLTAGRAAPPCASSSPSPWRRRAAACSTGRGRSWSGPQGPTSTCSGRRASFLSRGTASSPSGAG